MAVGPVHAGIIEPGHFRFQCMGEDVYNLQIFLGYQHRGVEEAIVAAAGSLPRQIALAETSAGATSAAAAIAFSELMERAFPERFPQPGKEALRLREILLELERIANHTGDLGALAGDVAFLQTASFSGRIRGEYLNMTALLCANRFGRNAIIPGGARIIPSAEKYAQIKDRIGRVKPELDCALKLMFHEHSVCDRFDGTGKVSKEIARASHIAERTDKKGHRMFRDLLSRIIEGCRTGAFPPGKPNLPLDFRGRPKLAADTTAEDVDAMKAVCPVSGALGFVEGKACLHMGRSIFCGRCAEACSRVVFTD